MQVVRQEGRPRFVIEKGDLTYDINTRCFTLSMQFTAEVLSTFTDPEYLFAFSTAVHEEATRLKQSAEQMLADLLRAGRP